MTKNKNLPATIDPKVSIAQYMSQDVTRKMIEETLGKRSQQFITSVVSLVNNNHVLKEADKKSVMSACLLAATLDLPINQNLGFAYIIPYKDKNQGGIQIAQFQIGYKGFIQLAMRSGEFAKLNVTDVKEGEIKGVNRLTGDMIFEWLEDEAREKAVTIGYVAYMELSNGFNKQYYQSIPQLQKHGKRFSKSFRKGYGLWVDDFESMAKKTVLKTLLSKYAPMSVAMSKAQVADQAVVDGDRLDYPDNTPDDVVIDGSPEGSPATQNNVNDFVAKKMNKAKKSESVQDAQVVKETPQEPKAKSVQENGGFDRQWMLNTYFGMLKSLKRTHDEQKKILGINSIKDLSDQQLLDLINDLKLQLQS